MIVNFCKVECQTRTSAVRFGIYDAENSTPAEVRFDDEPNWNAVVINDNAFELLFTAIDNCIEIVRENGDMENRCDGMLTYNTTLLFIELKNKRDSWQSDGLSQIEATIKCLIANDVAFYNIFTKRKAIVANRKNQFPSFQMAQNEQREYFWKNYKTRIQFDAEIIVG